MTVSTRDLLVDGLRLHVAEAGDGPALLLVHGLTASHAVWEHTIEAFADRWRVIALDLPGHGASAKPDAPYTIDFFAGMVRSLARALGVDEAVVIGSSLGGRVALELAAWYPRFTRALVLAAPAYGYSPAMRPIGRALQAFTG
ncbi:MAG TPA: alpha/beta fold hydrolase, partial [Burkholderiaceae bacterium]|nr:alpha/beta fold hydrolase [Burkholderiaceae bacterium]